MPLRIYDDTAGVLLLTIDDTGLICFGNGTPITPLTINGIGVIDSDGLITNQRADSGSIAPSIGSVTVPPGELVTLNTLTGIIPTVQLDAYWPNARAVHVIGPPDRCEVDDIYTTASHKVMGVQTGKFTVTNLTQPDDTGLCSTGIPDTVSYRWM